MLHYWASSLVKRTHGLKCCNSPAQGARLNEAYGDPPVHDHSTSRTRSAIRRVSGFTRVA
eukprot:1159319-Pelagomonas_calceolata.AAC.5